MGRCFLFPHRQKQYSQMAIQPKLRHRLYTILIKISHKTRKKNCKIHMETEETQNDKSDSNEDEQSKRSHFLDFKLHDTVTMIKTTRHCQQTTSLANGTE